MLPCISSEQWIRQNSTAGPSGLNFIAWYKHSGVLCMRTCSLAMIHLASSNDFAPLKMTVRAETIPWWTDSGVASQDLDGWKKSSA